MNIEYWGIKAAICTDCSYNEIVINFRDRSVKTRLIQKEKFRFLNQLMFTSVNKHWNDLTIFVIMCETSLLTVALR